MAAPLLNIKDATECLNISHHTLYKLLERKDVPAAKIGGSWRFFPEVLDQWVRKRMEESMGGWGGCGRFGGESPPILWTVWGLGRLRPFRRRVAPGG